ncbi:hypothetical protein ACVIGB_000979 [Bradyrhizobium sp. USDA 4341]
MRSLPLFFWIQASFSAFLFTSVLAGCLTIPDALSRGVWALLVPVPLLLWLARMSATAARQIAPVRR